jgi:zinc transport system substrate-binding protein
VERDKLDVFVSITPQAYFVDKIGGQFVKTDILVNPGQSPETYEPTLRQMTNLADCDVFFRIGLPFENHLLRKVSESIPRLNISNSVESIKLRVMDDVHGDDFTHDTNETHGATDPHVWLDPLLVKVVAENIFNELNRIDPEHKDIYTENLTAFLKELDSLDKKIEVTLEPYKGRSFIVFHPILGYFADRYGLNQIAVEIDGKEPGARQLVTLIDIAKKENVKTIFVQPQFSTKSARRIAESINGTVKTLDALAYDYINNMETIARKLAEGFDNSE